MKTLVLILLLCFACGCSSNKRYFKTEHGRGPYIPDYLTILPAKNSK